MNLASSRWATTGMLLVYYGSVILKLFSICGFKIWADDQKAIDHHVFFGLFEFLVGQKEVNSVTLFLAVIWVFKLNFKSLVVDYIYNFFILG